MNQITLEYLGIYNYRNLASVVIEPHRALNVLTGINGAGKTGILDAIYYLTNGRSYFASQDAYIYKVGENYFRVEGRIRKDDQKFILSLRSAIDKKKKIVVDDKLIPTIAEYYGRFACFMIAPRDIRILLDSSADRRKLADRTLSRIDRKYLNYLIDYNRLLRQRNAALKHYQKTRQLDRLLFDAIDKKMAEPAAYISAARARYVEKTGPVFKEFYGLLSGQRESLDIHYRSELIDRSMHELLKGSFEKDCMLGKTHRGIHRDDLELRINGHDIKRHASQGQLKSAIISLKLAQVHWVTEEKNISPILLLDDIFDKLDTGRVEQLLRLCIDKLRGQIFISDTEISKLNPILKTLGASYKHFIINQGELQN